MLVIKDWLTKAQHQLETAGIFSAKLDAELMLAHSIHKDRTYLHAHHEELLSDSDIATANELLEKRASRLPIAYLIGYKEFYGRRFTVTKDTLIPRPESEDIIDILKIILNDLGYPEKILRLVDVGTGSGCLGITSKLEFNNLEVALADIDSHTLEIAKSNADDKNIIVDTFNGDLLLGYDKPIDIIVANLPYVDKDWPRSPETDYEPELALFAPEKGTYLIKKLISQANKLLLKGSIIIIEADPTQHDELINFARKKSFKLINRLNYIVTFTKKY